jgi:hypothetical protein
LAPSGKVISIISAPGSLAETTGVSDMAGYNGPNLPDARTSHDASRSHA